MAAKLCDRRLLLSIYHFVMFMCASYIFNTCMLNIAVYKSGRSLVAFLLPEPKGIRINLTSS